MFGINPLHLNLALVQTGRTVTFTLHKIYTGKDICPFKNVVVH